MLFNVLFMAKNAKTRNPLALCWGLVLRKARESRSWEYSDIERMSGLSQDFYRNIEKAVFNLHVSQALPLHETFKNEVIGDTFSLDGIIQILSVISIMEAKANQRLRLNEDILDENEKAALYNESLLECAQELSYNSLKLEKLFEKYFELDLFKINDNNTILSSIENNGMIYSMEDFLVNYKTFGENFKGKVSSDYLNGFLDNVPSIYTEFLSDTKKKLIDLPVRMIFSELQKWEKSNEMKIEELLVLNVSNFNISSISNLMDYHYTYLFRKSFKRARILLLDVHLEMENSKEEFDSNMYKAYKKNKIKMPTNWDEGLSKMEFNVVKKLPDNLSDILYVVDEQGKKIKFDCLWIYKFTDETLVGFTTNPEKDIDFEATKKYIFNEGKNLYIKDVVSKYELLKHYFNS